MESKSPLQHLTDYALVIESLFNDISPFGKIGNYSESTLNEEFHRRSSKSESDKKIWIEWLLNRGICTEQQVAALKAMHSALSKNKIKPIAEMYDLIKAYTDK